MNRQVSLYLDLIRIGAAMTVFIGHVSAMRATNGFLWPIGHFKDEAVIVFFVLSGFVISYAASEKERNIEVFAVNRAARIYSVALPAILLTAILDSVGYALNPASYTGWSFTMDARATQFVSGLLFVNQVWDFNIQPGSNAPYWSLAYEVWYYITFAAYAFAPARWKALAVASAGICAGPNILSLFPIWLMGMCAYRICRKELIYKPLSYFFLFGSFSIWSCYEWVSWRFGRPPGLWNSYIVGTLFAANLVGFSSAGMSLNRVIEQCGGPIRWFAGITFSVYLYHFPIMQFLLAISPWPHNAWQHRILLIGGTFAVICMLAEATERRRNVWRRGIIRMVRLARRSLGSPITLKSSNEASVEEPATMVSPVSSPDDELLKPVTGTRT
jgi:peptidoglycan/LPS O-acetylase OafA/YrhL